MNFTRPAVATGLFETPLMAFALEEVRESLRRRLSFAARFELPHEYATLVRHIVENAYLDCAVIRLDAVERIPPR